VIAMHKTFTALLFVCLLVPVAPVQADDGYKLWLRNEPLTDRAYLQECERRFENVMITGDSPVMSTAHDEFLSGLSELTGLKAREVISPEGRGLSLQEHSAHRPILPHFFPTSRPVQPVRRVT